jgi:hypothetical protein
MIFYIPRPQNFKNDILNNKSVFFYSIPGTGKTEFVKNEILNDNILYINLSSSYTLKDVCLKIIKESDKFFNKKSNFNKSINDINLFKIALLYPIYESELRLFNLTICFDNFNYILNFDNKNSDLLKTISEVLLRSEINTIFTLNQVSSKDIFNSPNSYLYRFAKEIIFKKLDLKEVDIYSKAFLNKYDLFLDTKYLEIILNELSFNSMYLSLFFKELVLNKKEKTITSNDINICINKVYKMRSYEIKNELISLLAKKNISDILFYIANDENVYTLALEINKMQKSNVKKALNSLEDLGLIIQENSYKKYICRDKFLKRFILENFTKRGTND